jgi:hypothetical protein
MSDFQDGYYCFTNLDTVLIKLGSYYSDFLKKDSILYIIKVVHFDNIEYDIRIMGLCGLWVPEQYFIKCLLPYIRKLSDIELVIKDIIE